MLFQVTLRYDDGGQRYHTFTVDATDALQALRDAADQAPGEIAAAVDLVELRIAPDPERRSYLGEESPAG